MTRKLRFIAMTLFVSFGFALQAGVIVGLPADPINGNCIPFGCPVLYGVSTYQQVYSSADFSGSIDIGSIDFFNTTSLHGAVPALGTYSLSLSYTSKAVNALDLSNPANNITFGSQAFFSGSLPGLLGGELSFAGAPFLYNPALGNLLLTVSISGATDSSPILYLDESRSTSQLSRAYFGSSNGGSDTVSLITEFDAVPEPSTVLLLAGGLFALFLLGEKRKNPRRPSRLR